jgi:formamidopyrimidine-DNA glycosylase
MPELPELEIVREVLQRRAVGHTIDDVQLIGGGAAIVVRDLTNRGLAAVLNGATIAHVMRRGKFLVFTLSPSVRALSSEAILAAVPEIAASQIALHAMTPTVYLALNPKLAGRLQLARPGDRRLQKTHLILMLSGGDELRYVDQRTMGQLYLTTDLSHVPDFETMGPEPFDLSLVGFRDRLRPYRGEIKGILVRSEFIAGIGNAYADEILWAAMIHPYRKRTQLTPEEIDRLYHAMQSTLREATEHVRVEMGEAIHLEPREFLNVHLKTDKPCPRCGTRISLVGANERITNFCRTCQPGGLIKGMG